MLESIWCDVQTVILVEKNYGVCKENKKSVQGLRCKESNGVQLRFKQVSEHRNRVQHDFLHGTYYALQQVS